MPATRIELPGWVETLRDAPGPGALIDQRTPRSLALYYQTIHGKPLFGGAVARRPTSVEVAFREKLAALEAHDDRALVDGYDVRYVLAPLAWGDGVSSGFRAKVLHEEEGAALFEIVPAGDESGEGP